MEQGTQPSLPNVNEAGEVLAHLNDWRAIVFVLVFIIVVLLLERIWAQREMRLERREMRGLTESFANSAEKVSRALSSLRLEVMVLRATASRVESVVASSIEGDDDDKENRT